MSIEKILARCVQNNGCLEWTGSFQYSGKNRQSPYPNIRNGRKIWRGHRLVWTLLRGEIASGMCVMHTCDNTKCLNIEHLRIGTHSENMKDKISKGRDHNKKKDTCKNGHPFSGENLIVRKSGARSCRICMRVYWNKFDNKNKEKRRVSALARYYAGKEVQ